MYLGRDAGWINLCTYNPQEAYDLTLCAFKIAEDLKVRLPVMIHQDGFMCSHTAQNVRTLNDDDAYNFIGDYKNVNSMLDASNPITYGVQTEEDWHFEHKAKQHHALMSSFDIIKKVFSEFEKKSGRKYDLYEEYKLGDADIALVVLGTTYETTKITVDKLREKGIKAGVLGIRVLRPFPLEEIRDVLKNVKAVACMDRSAPGGSVGMLYNEISGALISLDKTPVICNYIYGLGGRDMTIAILEEVYEQLAKYAKNGKLEGTIQRFIGQRGPNLDFYSLQK
jgi:pyruvate ferredoxin oxidoreductase alpha subunit